MLSIKSQLRNKWLASRGFLSGPVGNIPNTPKARAENRQTNIRNKFKKPYRMGDKPRRVKHG